MREKLFMVIFILVLGSLLTAALLAVDNATAPIIEENAQYKITTNVLEALGIPFTEKDVLEKFTGNVNEKSVDGKTYYVSGDGKYAIEFSGSGLWGPIRGIIALQSDLETVAGITIIHQEETPGLGGRITEQWYLDQFAGKNVKPRLEAITPGKGQENANSIDAISGATLTSWTFIDILNQNLAEALPLIGGGS